MQKITKKEIRLTVEEAIGKALEKLKISNPTRKTKKLATKVSKAFTRRLKVEVRRTNKAAKGTKEHVNGKQKLVEAA